MKDFPWFFVIALMGVSAACVVLFGLKGFDVVLLFFLDAILINLAQLDRKIDKK